MSTPKLPVSPDHLWVKALDQPTHKLNCPAFTKGEACNCGGMESVNVMLAQLRKDRDDLVEALDHVLRCDVRDLSCDGCIRAAEVDCRQRVRGGG